MDWPQGINLDWPDGVSLNRRKGVKLSGFYKPLSKVIFAIQLGVFSKDKSAYLNSIYSLGGCNTLKKGKLYYHFVGHFESSDKALKELRKIETNKNKFFLIAFYNGNKISFSEGLKLEQTPTPL